MTADADRSDESFTLRPVGFIRSTIRSTSARSTGRTHSACIA